MRDIKVGIVGIGNCASSLVQGLFYYKDVDENSERVPGLMHNSINGYKPGDIKIVAAYDIDARKVGRDLRDAIFSKPNNTKIFCDVPSLGVNVKKSPVLDGLAEHMKDYDEDRRFVVSDERELTCSEIVEELVNKNVDVLISYLPVGSQRATEFYAECALDAGCAFVNCVPVFICSDVKWEKRFVEKGLPCIGDDIKAQLGATITHRVLADLFEKRGVKLRKTYQLNTGGNTDFLNMLDRRRLGSKKVSKTEAVQSQLAEPLDKYDIHIGPSDYVAWQNDNKVCFIRMEGLLFGDVPMNLELRLSVEDSPNSAGCAIDAIRLAKLGLDRKVSGNLRPASAYLMKHPPEQFTDDRAYKMLEDFIAGKSSLKSF